MDSAFDFDVVVEVEEVVVNVPVPLPAPLPLHNPTLSYPHFHKMIKIQNQKIRRIESRIGIVDRLIP